MRYPLIVNVSIFSAPFLIVESLFVATVLVTGMAIGAIVTGVRSHKRHQHTVREHQAALRVAFGVGVEAHRRHPR